MEFDNQTTRELEHLEIRLRLFIQKGYTPFLGLQKRLLKSDIRGLIHNEFRRCYDSLQTYLSFLKKWPAIFVTYLTLYVSEGFGEHGTFEVYPFIERALHLKELTYSQREKLWKAYWQACDNLGLSVSYRMTGPHFMVDEYLRQAGVPLKYVPDLADRMLRHANAVGLPDDDDPNAIRLWQQGLCEHLTTPFPRTARKAVEIDDSGYYTRYFLNIIDKPIVNGDEQDFECLMSKAIHDVEGDVESLLKKKGLGLKIPQVVWRDQQVGVELPPSTSDTWLILTGNGSTEYTGILESRFVPLENVLPPEITIMGHLPTKWVNFGSFWSFCNRKEAGSYP